MKYRKRPVEVEAIQIHGNVSEIKEFIGENGDAYTAGSILDRPHTVVTIRTLEGSMKATDGDYIIKGVKGEFYPCRKDIFEETYELAESEESDNWAYLLFDRDRIKAHKERRTKEAEESKEPFKKGDRVKFKTMGGWYNGGIIKDVDESTCLIEVDTFGNQSLKYEYVPPLPYYTRVLSYTLIPEQEVEE